MNDNGLARLIIVFALCTIATIAIPLVLGFKFPIYLVLILLLGFGSVFAWIYHGMVSGDEIVVDPDQPFIAPEHDLFQPLIDLVTFYEGNYEFLGRAGKAIIHLDENDYLLTARLAADGVILTVATAMPKEGFRLELSAKEIHRKDVSKFELDEDEFDEQFFVGANEEALASQALRDCTQPLCELGKEVSLTTVRGSLELRRRMFALTDDNVERTFEIFRSIHQAIARHAVEADPQEVVRL